MNVAELYELMIKYTALRQERRQLNSNIARYEYTQPIEDHVKALDSWRAKLQKVEAEIKKVGERPITVG